MKQARLPGEGGQGGAPSPAPSPAPASAVAGVFESIVRTPKPGLLRSYFSTGGRKLRVLRDRSNAKDPHAIKLVTTTAQPAPKSRKRRRGGDNRYDDDGGEEEAAVAESLEREGGEAGRAIEVGHLPAGAAKHLCEALAGGGGDGDDGDWEALATIVQDDAGASRLPPVHIRIEFTPSEPAAGAATPQKRRLRAILARARAGQKQQFKSLVSAQAGSFDILIRHATDRYAHLFAPEELALVEKIARLSAESKAFFARLSSRTVEWIRLSAIAYVEFSNIDR